MTSTSTLEGSRPHSPVILSSEDSRCDDASCILCRDAGEDESSLDLSDLWSRLERELPDVPASPHVEVSPDPSGDYGDLLQPVLEMSQPGYLGAWEAACKSALAAGLERELGGCIPFPKMWYTDLSLDEIAPVVQKDLEVYHVALVRLRATELYAPGGKLRLADEAALLDAEDIVDYRTRANVVIAGRSSVRRARTGTVSESLRIVPKAYRYGFCKHTVLYEDRVRDVVFAERLLRPLRGELGHGNATWIWFDKVCPDITRSKWWIGLHHPTFVDQSRCLRYSAHTPDDLRELAREFCDRYDTSRGCLECHYMGPSLVCEVCRRTVHSVAWTGGDKGVMACVGANGCFSQARYKHV